jgi:integrase
MDNGTFTKPSNVTLAKYLEKWLEDTAAPTVTPKTLEEYRQKIRRDIIPALGHHTLSRLHASHIKEASAAWRRSGRKDGTGGLSPRSVLHLHNILHRALGEAVTLGTIQKNPCDNVPRPRPERTTMKAIDEDDTARLLAALTGTMLYLPVLVAVTTGMRRGEILGLLWQDVDLVEGRLSVNQSLEQTTEKLRFKQPKTARGRRTILLDVVTVEALRRHRAEQFAWRQKLGDTYQDQGLVVCRRDGKPMRPDTFSGYFLEVLRRKGLPLIRFHDLRHSCASQMLRQGDHPKVVQEKLGHSGIAITMDTYSHLLPGLQEQSAQRTGDNLREAMRKVANE